MEIKENVKIDGRYVIQHLIGEGGMANVYLATDIILNRSVAVKILHDQLAKQERFIERFRREAEAVASLINPNIVEIYDVGQYEEHNFIVMELLRGTTLKEYIKTHQHLSISEAVLIMKQVCNGVRVAHQHGIIHRDLKPQNIFILADGTVKIMDFGIAYQQDATPLTQTNAVMGSVHYLSPEQAKGESATIQTDIYSLGVVMYEMLVGEVPFTGESAVNIVLQHLRDEMPYIRDKNDTVPQSVENVVIKSTAKNPMDRYQELSEMYEDLDTCLNMERLNEPRLYFEPYENDELANAEIEMLEHSEQQQKMWQKHKKKLIAIIAVVGLLIIGGITSIVLNNQGYVTMPDVMNKTSEEAKLILEGQELKLGAIEQVASDTIEVGKVVSTDQQVNVKIAKGTIVNLKISKGKMTKMPSIVGRKIADVEPLLTQQGIKYTIVEKAPDTEVEDGTVLKQSILEGADVFVATDTLEITIAKTELISLQNLSGYHIDNAKTYATEKGLILKIEEEYSETIQQNYIVNVPDWYQGRKVAKGTEIRVIVSKGPKPVEKTTPVPDKSSNNNSNNNTSTNNRV